MREATTEQLEVLDAKAFVTHFRVRIRDGDNVWRDYAYQSGRNWITSVDVDVDVDQPVSTASIALRRDIIDGSGLVKSLSPLIEASVLNRNGVGAYAPAVDAGREVEVLVATTAPGVDPTEDDWQSLFYGTLDDFSLEKSPIVLTARDLGGALADAFIQTGDTDYGSAEGVPIEAVMDAILADWAPDIGGVPVTLYCPESPGEMITTYKPKGVSVMDALQTLAGYIGWDVRYRWDATTGTWRLTFAAVDRAKTVPDRVIPESRCLAVQRLTVSRVGVRNSIKLSYTDTTGGTSERKELILEDADSIERYGLYWMEIDEGSDSPIDSPPEAGTYLGSILSDLKDPKADQTIEEHFDWTVELGDLQRYTANGKHYDVDQDLAVVSYKHSLSANKHRTTVSVRGRPCGRYLGWLDQRNTPYQPAAMGPTLVVRKTMDATAVKLYVRYTGVLSLAIGEEDFVDAMTAGVTTFPYTVARPGIGLEGLVYTFRASLNGQDVTSVVDIPAQETPPPVTPPDSAYAGGGGQPVVHYVHAEVAGRMKLAEMPSGRTELDAGTHFSEDITNLPDVRLASNVMTAGAAGSKLALEYYNEAAAAFALAGSPDITVPVDATGLQEGTGTLVAGLTGRRIFRVVTLGGNGVASPVLGNTYVGFYPAATAAAARAAMLYLRDEAPSAGPAAADFPLSAAMPAHVYGTGTNRTAGATAVRSLSATKGLDITETGILLPYGVQDSLQPRDLFPGAFLSAPFNSAQSVATGPWEIGCTASRTNDNYHIFLQPVLYLLRNMGGTWSKVTTIYDAHNPAVLSNTWIKGAIRVCKMTVPGASFDAEPGDVLAFEPWAHMQWIAEYHKTGHPAIGVDDGAGRLYYGGQINIPLGSPDQGFWDAVAPASYVKPPESLLVG